MKRMSRDKYFMKIAEVVSERSTCSRAKVGAVLVDITKRKIAAVGYNGSVPGSKHCIDHECLEVKGHCRRTVHAALNAVLHLDNSSGNLVLYCTHQPCAECCRRADTCCQTASV